MKDIYIVSDVHGRYEALVEALYSVGIFDYHGVKDPNAYVVQIGDLANCVGDPSDGEDDMACLQMVGNEIDLMLIGNHEIPYFDTTNRFVGFHFDQFISEKLWGLYKNELLVAAYSVNGHLVTHAGVTAQQLRNKAPEMQHVRLLKDHVNQEWKDGNFSYSLFRDCGRARLGRAAYGGMLWCDFDREFTPTTFPQIVGHTSGILRQKGNAICIDTGAKYGGKPQVLKVW